MIIPRAEWGAQPPKRVTAFRLPAAELYLHHLASEWHGPEGVRQTQRFHQETRGWRDIAYTFLVDDDGTVYEGTGPYVVGSHTKGRNSRSMAICAMGNFDERSPSPRMLSSISWLIRHGRQQRWWGDLSGGHRDVRQTACPGRFLYARIPEIKAASEPTRGWLMALSDEKQERLFRMVDELHGLFVRHREQRHGDEGAHLHDLATPILTTNHLIVEDHKP